MKKFILPILLFLMFVPVSVIAKEKVTIIYDSNDNTGRVKEVEYDRGEYYTLENASIFNPIGLDSNDPMDDRLISGWCLNSDCTNWCDDDNCTHKFWDGLLAGRNYTFNSLNNTDNLRLYARWDGRKEISNQLKQLAVSGDAVSQNENGEYIIENYKDFEINFDFREKGMFGIGQYSYYKLPKYFTDTLYDASKRQLETPNALPIRLSNNNIFNGSFFIKDDILYIDFPFDDSYDSYLFNIGYVSFAIKYKVSYIEKLVNNRLLYVAKLTIILNNNEEPESSVEVYPTGKIKIMYVDVDSNKEIIKSEIKEDVLGTKFVINPKDILGYKLINNMNDYDLEYDDSMQEIILKYKKIDNNQIKIPETLKNPNTSTGLSIIIMIILFVSFISYIIFKRKKNYIIK